MQWSCIAHLCHAHCQAKRSLYTFNSLRLFSLLMRTLVHCCSSYMKQRRENYRSCPIQSENTVISVCLENKVLLTLTFAEIVKGSQKTERNLHMEVLTSGSTTSVKEKDSAQSTKAAINDRKLSSLFTKSSKGSVKSVFSQTSVGMNSTSPLRTSTPTRKSRSFLQVGTTSAVKSFAEIVRGSPKTERNLCTEVSTLGYTTSLKKKPSKD